MTHSLRRLALLPLAIAAGFAATAHAQTPADKARDALPGKEVFDSHCAVCHEHSDVTHAPTVAMLHTFPAERINTALTTGVMRSQGASLSDEERDQVVAYLAAGAAVSSTSTTTTTTSTSTTKTPGA